MDCRRAHKTQIIRKETYLPLLAGVLLLCLLLLPTRLYAQPSIAALMAKGDSCRDVCLFNRALSFYQQAYDNPSLADNPEQHMQLLERIMRTHFILSHWKEMPLASRQLFYLAKQHDNTAYLAKAYFMRGVRLCIEGDKELGYKTCLEAMAMMKKSDCPDKYHELTMSCALLTNLYISGGRFNDAQHMLDDMESYAHLDRNNGAERLNLRRAYAARMNLLALRGRNAEADSLYSLYNDSTIVDPVAAPSLLNYLRLRGKTDESLRFVERGIQHLYADGDTIGRNMRKLINDKGDIYFRMGEYQKAAECYADMGKIGDSISVYTLRNLALDVDMAIDTERTVNHHRQLLIITISGILLLSVIIILLLRQSMMERKKNRSMMGTIQQLMRYRDQILLNGDSVEMGKNDEEKPSDEERLRFKEIDRHIMKERLFAQPDFGRDELMRLFGVDKNTLPSIIQRYAGTNVPGYVNNKRMEYAVMLIKQHPEYSLGAISEACGIKSPATFIRNFKHAYGMTPSEFRKQLDEDELPPPFINN